MDDQPERTFSCVSSNPVSKETTINITDVCSLNTEIFSSVGVSSVQEVIGAVGQSVTFPLTVPDTGVINYNGDSVGLVFNKQSVITSEKFQDRLHWVSQSGFFTLSDLRTDDSGLYNVQSTKEPKGKQDYHLEVYERVSAPHVTTTSRSSEFCSLLCSVRNVRGLKLMVYEDHVLLNQTSSSSTSDITLNLHLEIKKMDNHTERTFSCVSSNPVSNETTPINITDVCSLNTGGRPDPHHPDKRIKILITVLVSVLLVSAVMGMMVYLKKKRQNEASLQREVTFSSEGQKEEILYSVINHKNPPETNIRERVDGEEACPLTTVYDQIRPERTSVSDNTRTE